MTGDPTSARALASRSRASRRDPDAVYAWVRRVLLALPHVEERMSHGEAAWFIRGGRQVATMADHHHDDRFGIWFAAPPDAQAALVGTAPDRFFVPPYVGVRGWVGAWLDVPVDWEELEGLLRDAHRMVAPSRPGTRPDTGAEGAAPA
jgi:hypothetical protein